MTNYVDLNTITIADLLNGFNAILYNAVDNYLSTKLPVGGPVVGSAGLGVEKPLTTEEACEFLQISEPVLVDLVRNGVIIRHKFKGVKGYRYFASELVAALKG
jgi:excisionase family DNA binding protein